MTSESRDSSLLGDNGKHIPATANMQATVKEPSFLCNSEVNHTTLGVFSVQFGQSGYKDEFS
jgi:hypothetical protein